MTYKIDQKVILINALAKPALQQMTTLPAKADISGKVVDDKGKPLPGASVSVKGQGKTVSTNDEGIFLLEDVQEPVTLIVSFIGYIRKEVEVVKNQQLVITLMEDVGQLNNVIVVGYDSKKQNELTSAVAVVSSAKLKDVTANNVGTMLQGKVAGLQVVNSSGAPGSVPEIRLRGVSSVNANQSPLVVVDGIIGGIMILMMSRQLLCLKMQELLHYMALRQMQVLLL
ncbi:carboxypeptidase-like regulatory domain-containing protein [Pedobacter steynii]